MSKCQKITEFKYNVVLITRKYLHPLPHRTLLGVCVGRNMTCHMENISQNTIFLSYIKSNSWSPTGACHKSKEKWGCLSTVWSQRLSMDVHPVSLQSGVVFLIAKCTFSHLRIPNMCLVKGDVVLPEENISQRCSIIHILLKVRQSSYLSAIMWPET